MPDVRHIVWDWNGTLMNDGEAAWQACARTVADFGGIPPTFEEYQNDVNPGALAGYYQQLLGGTLPDGGWPAIDEVWNRHFAQVGAACTLAATARPALDQWATRGTQSLLTLHHQQYVVDYCTRLGIHQAFTRIDGRTDVWWDDWKGPALVRHLDALGIAGESVVLVGDTVADSKAAEYVGARCILYGNGVHHRDRLAATGHPVVDCLLDAVRLAESGNTPDERKSVDKG